MSSHPPAIEPTGRTPASVLIACAFAATSIVLLLDQVLMHRELNACRASMDWERQAGEWKRSAEMLESFHPFRDPEKPPEIFVQLPQDFSEVTLSIKPEGGDACFSFLGDGDGGALTVIGAHCRVDVP